MDYDFIVLMSAFALFFSAFAIFQVWEKGFYLIATGFPFYLLAPFMFVYFIYAEVKSEA